PSPSPHRSSSPRGSPWRRSSWDSASTATSRCRRSPRPSTRDRSETAASSRTLRSRGQTRRLPAKPRTLAAAPRRTRPHGAARSWPPAGGTAPNRWLTHPVNGGMTSIGDLRLALRGPRRSPLFASVAILSLALGIGANTAIFTLIDQILLRKLPIKDPDRL